MCVCVCDHVCKPNTSGDNSVGLVGKHLLPLIDGVNPRWLDKIQITVVHQRLQPESEGEQGGNTGDGRGEGGLNDVNQHCSRALIERTEGEK